jgi:hypothetical protein
MKYSGRSDDAGNRRGVSTNIQYNGAGKKGTLATAETPVTAGMQETSRDASKK